MFLPLSPSAHPLQIEGESHAATSYRFTGYGFRFSVKSRLLYLEATGFIENRAHYLLLALGLVFAGSRFALAQSPSVSDSLTVYDANKNVFASTSVDEASEDTNVIYTVDLPGVDLFDPSQFGNPTNLIEPDGTSSDIFGIASVNGSLHLAFASDIDDGLGTPFGGGGTITLPEGNGVFDATMYLNPSLQRDGFTAVFISDAEAVPEPGSVALVVGLGAVGAGLLRRRRK